MRTVVRLARFVGTAGVVTLGIALVPSLSRAGLPGAGAPRTAEVAEKSASNAMPMHGAPRLIEKALDEVQLRPEQKSAIAKIKADAEKRHAPVKAARSEFLGALADQIEKGKLDRCALAPAIKALASAGAEAHPGDRAAFEQLHSILNAEQRAAFVEALKRNWESLQKFHEPAALAEKVAKELNLSADQKASLEKIFAGIHEVRQAEPWYAAHRERWTKILDAFKGDRFVLDEVAPMGDVAAHSTARVEGRLWAGEAMLPVLEPEQRKAVADKLRERVKEAAPAGEGLSPSVEPSEEE
jgi:Spy/CpxP family protein refolding chaperone